MNIFYLVYWGDVSVQPVNRALEVFVKAGLSGCHKSAARCLQSC